MDSQPASTPAELAALEALIDTWMATRLAEDPAVVHVERATEPDLRRWYVRLHGDAKDVYSVWFTLRQRTLHVETYFMPAPPNNAEQVYRQLLVRNANLYGMAFCVGEEDAVYLAGQLANAHVDDDALDRLLGTVVATVELAFLPAVRLAFG